MFVFKKAHNPNRTLNDLDAYLNSQSTEPIKWLAREVQSWGEFSYAELEAAILDGRLEDIIDWQARYAAAINAALAPQWAQAIEAASKKSSRGKVILSDTNDWVKAWLTAHGAELATELSDESKKAIANVLLKWQGEFLRPREMAQQIRPLIGLNERQAIANANYRAKLYQRMIDEGVNPKVANQRADSAAVRYAGKQHRYRAETIVNTELAFAYNQGAHEGVQRSIAGNYMNHCEMVWTTAGTNRVCGRCMELKDTVVGRTNESGVTLPPLHPRCRCAIMYREVRSANRLPKITIINYSDAAKVRSQAEFITLAEQLKPDIERYTARQSKWSGKILLADNPDSSGCKYWDCSIRLNTDAPLHALIHELIHSCSVSHYGAKTFALHRWEEELTVHYLSQELAQMGKLAVVKSDYDSGVKLIREFKVILGVTQSDLEFATELIKEPLGERWNWLWEKIADKMNSGASLEQGQELMSKLEAIRRWSCE